MTNIHIALFVCWFGSACTAAHPKQTSAVVLPSPISSVSIPSPAISCEDCPDRTLSVSFRSNEYYFAALRFFDKGQPVHAESFSASRTPGDRTLVQPMRFGNIYLIQGNPGFIMPLRQVSLSCIRGRDTMQVYFEAGKFQNLAYDSIPFRAGRYHLVTTSREVIGDLPADFYVSFADYFRQHEAELAQANPFAGCRFPDDPNPVPRFKEYVPATPTEIFRLLLQHTKYERQVEYQLRPLVKGQIPTD